ncbi:MAG: JAB domain-containing protein [Gemmatimonadota bacterium]
MSPSPAALRARLLRLTRENPELVPALLLAAEDHKPAPSAVREAADAVRHLSPLLAGQDAECLVALALDRRNGVVGCALLTRGNDAHTIVDPKQVLRWALMQGRSGAAAIIVAHNHPSGDVTPSSADVQVTARLSEACRVVGVELLDHLVIAGRRHSSLRELGLYQPPFRQGVSFAGEAGRCLDCGYPLRPWEQDICDSCDDYHGYHGYHYR